MICKNCNKKLADPWAGTCPDCGATIQTREGNGFFDLVNLLDGKSCVAPEPDLINQKLTKLEQDLVKQKQECLQLRRSLSTAKKLLKVLLIASLISVVLSVASLIGLMLTDGGEYVETSKFKGLQEKVENLEDSFESFSDFSDATSDNISDGTGDESENVSKDESEDVSKDESEDVSKDESEDVSKDESEDVSKDESEDVSV